MCGTSTDAVSLEWVAASAVSAVQHWLAAASPTWETRKAAILELAGKYKEDPDLEKIVEEAYRRRGIAAEMIAFVESQFTPAVIAVGTQVANLPSVRLYEKLGFRLASTQYVFHFHNPAIASS